MSNVIMQIQRTLTVLQSQVDELDRQTITNGDVSEAEKRSEAARKAHRTRKANAEREKRVNAAKKAVRTRRRNANK